MAKNVTIEVQHSIGDIVFLLTDPGQLERMVVGYTITPGEVYYRLGFDGEITEHFSIEICATRDIVKATKG